MDEYVIVFALAFVMAVASAFYAFYAFDAVYAFGEHERVKHESYLSCSRCPGELEEGNLELVEEIFEWDRGARGGTVVAI